MKLDREGSCERSARCFSLAVVLTEAREHTHGNAVVRKHTGPHAEEHNGREKSRYHTAQHQPPIVWGVSSTKLGRVPYGTEGLQGHHRPGDHPNGHTFGCLSLGEQHEASVQQATPLAPTPPHPTPMPMPIKVFRFLLLGTVNGPPCPCHKKHTILLGTGCPVDATTFVWKSWGTLKGCQAAKRHLSGSGNS